MNYFYIICPVGTDPMFSLKKSVLRDLGDEYSMEPFFPLEHHPTFSMETVSRDVRLAALVLADLSLERPSCYFELGIAEALGTKVAVIAAKNTMIHQVGSAPNVSFYSNITEYRSVVSGILASYGATSVGH